MYNLQLKDILGEYRKECLPTWWSKSAAKKLSKMQSLNLNQGGSSLSSAKKPVKTKKTGRRAAPSPENATSCCRYNAHCNMLRMHEFAPISYSYGNWNPAYGTNYDSWYG